MLLRSLSTVLAQDHFYSDFLSLLLTKKIHFESVRMIAFAQHSLSVLTSVKLMIECVVHLLSRFLCQSFIKLNCGFILFGGFGNGLLLKNYCLMAAPSWRRFLAHLTILHFARKKYTCIRFCCAVPKAPLVFRMHCNFAGSHQFDHTFSAFWL